MKMDMYDNIFSKDVGSFFRSPVREIFKRVDLNAIYSFAGGYPSAETFPLEDIRRTMSEVIDKYLLNSSANVRRVKDALKKKEVITFNEKDEPVVLDPLFEYWLRRTYFEIPE